MNSIHFQKNPTLGQAYWKEVCGKADATHIFHHSRHGVKDAPRSYPQSTAQASFHGGQALGYELTPRQLPFQHLQAPPLSARSSRRGNSLSLSAGGRSSLVSASPRQTIQGSTQMSLGRRLRTPSERPPAGA
eukprot:TRINITY_DN36091_c0_g1_i1.p1 TRINITY_DN36091_c0_g1~~TRINITY_DN36091_c0_g1_i1.p1  ORF type:complete len:132 (-),score=8.97 TRINITY_DN36091_c0_g1_i1:72-467(-)